MAIHKLSVVTLTEAFILAFCHVDIDVCIYGTCTFFDCQADFDVDNVQRCELVNLYVGIALYSAIIIKVIIIIIPLFFSFLFFSF